MSIVIKSNELNTIVYKYLLEAGLSHTAYVMFNEAKLQSSLQEFKFDLKSGHLLTLLEKALIFTQLQAHVNFGQYNECLEPFYLLKSHTCKITQKIKQDTNNFMKSLNNNLTECIKRTNAIYNTELVNKNYEEIIYDPRGKNYFQKFQKLKISDGQVTERENDSNSNQPCVKIDGQREQIMAVWQQFFYCKRNRNDNVIYVTQNNTLGDILVNKIYPCIYDNQFMALQAFKLTSQFLVMVFAGNNTKIIYHNDNDRIIEFSLGIRSSINEINPNPNAPHILSFQGQDEYFVINTKQMKKVFSGKGILKWRGFDQYVLFDQSNILLKSLIRQESLITYSNGQNDQSNYMGVDGIEISSNKTFFFASNLKKNKIWVYTFEKEEPLYIFDFSQEEQKVKQVIWVYRNEVEYLCILTDLAVRVWEVELNAYSLKIDIQNYKLGQVKGVSALQKNDLQTFLLVLGTENLLVSDIANQKNERIESPINANQIQNLGRNSVFISTDQNIYFLNGERLSELFI